MGVKVALKSAPLHQVGSTSWWFGYSIAWVTAPASHPGVLRLSIAPHDLAHPPSKNRKTPKAPTRGLTGSLRRTRASGRAYTNQGSLRTHTPPKTGLDTIGCFLLANVACFDAQAPDQKCAKVARLCFCMRFVGENRADPLRLARGGRCGWGCFAGCAARLQGCSAAQTDPIGAIRKPHTA